MTDDEKQPSRPNANYKLSKLDNGKNPVDDDEPLHFHYNRERRLAKAPQAVKDLYVEQKHHSFNLLRPLVSTKSKATLFFTIVILCVLILVFSILGYFDKSYSLDGNKLDIWGIKYDGTIIVAVKKTLKKSGAPYYGAVDVAVSPAISSANAEDEDFPVFYHRVFFSLEPEEDYRFVVPFDSPELVLVLQTEKSTLKLKMKPE